MAGAGATVALNLTGKITKLDGQYSEAGGFSDVYKCRYASADGMREVAVKAFRFYFTVTENERGASKTEKMIRRELGIWRRLRHPNIVPFLGFVHDFERRGRTSLVSVWMPNGTLGYFCEQYDDRLMLAHRLQLLVDIANGLSYLHLFPLVHGDLTGTNVLVDENFNARLTDFGLASMVGDIPEALRYLQMTTTRPGAIRWCAPECFSVDTNSVGQRTTKSDIYSFGNLALLVLSGKQPWSEVPQDIAVIFRLHQGDKPSRPTGRLIEDEHWELIEHCWSAVDERPRAGSVISSLKRFLDLCTPAQPLRGFLFVPPDTAIGYPDFSTSMRPDLGPYAGVDPVLAPSTLDPLTAGFIPYMPSPPTTPTISPEPATMPLRDVYDRFQSPVSQHQRAQSHAHSVFTRPHSPDQTASLYTPPILPTFSLVRREKVLKAVFLPRDCVPRFLSISTLNTLRDRETCGLLLGKRLGGEYVVTTMLIPKQHSTRKTSMIDDAELVTQFTEERSLITLGWILTHPSNSYYMSPMDMHDHAIFQRAFPESFVVICAPKSLSGIFRLTDPLGLDVVLHCRDEGEYHRHPSHFYSEEADARGETNKGHVRVKDLPLEIVDLR